MNENESPMKTYESEGVQTVAPGKRTFDEVMDNFENGLANSDNSDFDGFTKYTSDELVWLQQENVIFKINEKQGYRFNNNDILILFQITTMSSMEESEEAECKIEEQAETVYGNQDRSIRVYINGEFGFVLVSSNITTNALSELAIRAWQT